MEDNAKTVHYSAFHRWMCDRWIDDNEEGYDAGELGIVSLNVQGVPDLYGEDPSSSKEPVESVPTKESLKTTIAHIVIEAQAEAARGLKETASEEERSRAQLRVMSALLATLSYTLTQTSPTV